MTTAVVLAYLLGSVPFSLILARHWGVPDLRHVGSGNLGATNVARTSGLTAGLLVALLDIGKGAGSVWLAERLSGTGATCAVAGLAAIIGHIYPVWARFRGGKGVATACGVFAMLAPTAALAALGIFAAIVWITRFVSVGSVVAAVAVAPIAYLTGSPRAVVGAALAAAGLIVFRHRSNLARIRAGTEHRLSLGSHRSPGGEIRVPKA
jgi:glycerol-3-phosphate acyltransferase PlsY